MPTTLPLVYSESEAAKALGLTVHTLRRIRRQGLIGFARTSPRRIIFFQRHLDEYLKSTEVTPCSNGSKTESSGSANVQIASSGAEPGSIRNLDRHDAHRLAQAILKRRSSS
jgi:hypothetical protein